MASQRFFKTYYGSHFVTRMTGMIVMTCMTNMTDTTGMTSMTHMTGVTRVTNRNHRNNQIFNGRPSISKNGKKVNVVTMSTRLQFK